MVMRMRTAVNSLQSEVGGGEGGRGGGGGEEEPRYILVYLLYAKVFKTCVPHGDRCNLCA